jgi:hypothetical protein
MSKIVKVSGGDYRVEVQGALNPATGLPTTGGSIILDTKSSGTLNGMVTILGNLEVKGTTSTIESTDTYVKDTVITLNYGQTGAGIGNGTGAQVSGLEIARGSRSTAQLLFSEIINHWNPATNAYVPGTFTLKTADGALSGLQVGVLANDGTQDFTFDLQSGLSVLKVANTTDYYSRVVDDNHIPNKKFITNYVAASGGIADVTNIHYPINVTSTPILANVVCGNGTVISTIWNGSANITKLTVNSTGVTMGNVLIANDSVSNTSANNLILGATNNNVEIAGTLNLNYQADQLAPSGNANKVYSKATEGPGRTGIYFTSSNAYGATAYNNDELVSKNRAVLLSILL